MFRLAALSFVFIAGSAYSKVQVKRVVYESAGEKMEGYLAWNDSQTRTRPGVIVVHDWNGVDAYEERRARMLAELGYVAFACDIYGRDNRPKSNSDNGRLAGKFKSDRKLYRQRLNDGLAVLMRERTVDKSKLAAIGYCFGGTGILELARSGAKVAGVVSFHGGLDNPTPSDDANIKGQVLICHGADDPMVPMKDQDAFRASLRAYHVPLTWRAYAGAVHAFTVPEAGSDNSRGAAYNKAADEKSWLDMKAFFKKVLGK